MKFKLKDRVIIKELGVAGLVRRIQIEEAGILYEVRYFWEAKAEGIWFYEDELKREDKKENETCPIHH